MSTSDAPLAAAAQAHLITARSMAAWDGGRVRERSCAYHGVTGDGFTCWPLRGLPPRPHLPVHCNDPFRSLAAHLPVVGGELCLDF